MVQTTQSPETGACATTTQALHIVNADPRYAPVTLIAPTTRGYIHIAAEVSPPSRPGPVITKGPEKAALVATLKEAARQLEARDAVEKVTIFEATVFAPPSPYIEARDTVAHRARFDIVVLIETTSPAAARDVQTAPSYLSLLAVLASKAKHIHVVAARNAKRIGDVDTTRKGLFLFNYFVADDANVMLQLWDYLAGWYETETGLDNSTLLVPLEGERSDYLAINNARWDGGPLRLFARQLPKKSFRRYMLANLTANHVGAMPVLYRLA